MNVKMEHRTWWKLLAAVVIVLAAIGGSLFGYWRWKYPYGWSHCCIKDKRLRSKPVTVQVSSTWVTPNAIVFEMEPY